MSEVGYRSMLDRLMKGGIGAITASGVPLGYMWANEAYEHPDFDIPGVLVTTVGSRTLLIVEGERDLVYPIIEKANEIAEDLS